MEQSDLTEKSAEELRALKATANRLLKDKLAEQQIALDEMASEIREKLGEAGLPLDGLIKTLKGRSRTAVPKEPRLTGKFRNPSTGEIYTPESTGRYPTFIKEAIDQGNLDDYRIEDTAEQPG